MAFGPGTEHLLRLRAEPDDLVLDDFRPRYRSAGGDQGLAWDACLSGDAVWVMDNGDVPSVRHIHTTFPNGRFADAPALSWRQHTSWDGPQRLLRATADGRVHNGNRLLLPRFEHHKMNPSPVDDSRQGGFG